MASGEEKALHPFIPVIRELEARNAPVYIELSSSSLYQAVADVYWCASNEHLCVGSLSATGTGSRPYRYTLRTDRIDYIYRKRQPAERVIKYVRLKGLIDGLVKYSIPLKGSEQREMRVLALKKKVDNAHHELYGYLGRSHRLIGENVEPLIDLLLFGHRSGKIELLVGELHALLQQLQVARHEYEGALHEAVPREAHEPRRRGDGGLLD